MHLKLEDISFLAKRFWFTRVVFPALDPFAESDGRLPFVSFPAGQLTESSEASSDVAPLEVSLHTLLRPFECCRSTARVS